MIKTPAVNRCAGIEHGAQQHRQLCHHLLAQPGQNINPDDQRHANKAEARAAELPRTGRRAAHNQGGNQEHEDRRGRIQDPGQAAVHKLLAPGQQGPCTDRREHGLNEQLPPSRGVAGQRRALPGQDGLQEHRSDADPCRDQRHRRNIRHGDLDQQIRRTPEQRQHREQAKLELEAGARIGIGSGWTVHVFGVIMEEAPGLDSRRLSHIA